ncbi:RsiV family protein [Winogradskyella bathintestinalis]|uniref:RsiV family protein n=1 Tax=Winogradskyella bathintestinalis TaxID=3035208 RepID=A0ABT7ZW37_9FLAO|nr:RsiV family protein [Winogradskyella bathintestinalis]MDN3493232.1 RsiV family protein [Winogradskyella bathintestinalis]
MKYLYVLLLFVILSACKDDKQKENIIDSEIIEDINPVAKETLQFKDEDIESLDKSITIKLKQKRLIQKADESEELEELIIDKKYLVEKDDYTINFKYPLLNETYKPTNSNFNEFINDYYVNITKSESDILESKLLCDSIEAKTFREERFIDYKIYNVNDQLVSVLFYKENFYSGAMHPSYSFDGFNFDLNRGVFMTYEDFFNQGSEEELVGIINEKINEQIGEGDMYYDCWELSLDDFFTSKNNFVLNDTYVEFYFDDCVICPSYTGTYSIELPLTDLLSVLKKYDLNPLIF